MKIGIPKLTMKQKWFKFIWKKQFFFKKERVSYENVFKC